MYHTIVLSEKVAVAVLVSFQCGGHLCQQPWSSCGSCVLILMRNISFVVTVTVNAILTMVVIAIPIAISVVMIKAFCVTALVPFQACMHAAVVIYLFGSCC